MAFNSFSNLVSWFNQVGIVESLIKSLYFGTIALTMRSVDGAPKSRQLLDLGDPRVIQNCKVMSDADTGGFSRVSLDHIPGAAVEPAHARFHGSISTKLPLERIDIQRTGYAAWRNRDGGVTIFGRSLWDIDPFLYLGIEFKSDGRKYFVNVQTESIVPTDLHQHRLYTQKPGEWEKAFINWNEFVRTNHGTVIEPQQEIMRQKVRTVGIGLIDRNPGPFDLRISRMWATNEISDVQEGSNL